MTFPWKLGSALSALSAVWLAGWFILAAQDKTSDKSYDDEVKRAKAAIEEALQKDPENSQLWVHLGFAERNMQQIDQAQTAFEKAIALNPKNVTAHFMLALIYEKKKSFDKARTSWRVCLEHSKDERIKEIARKHLALLEKTP